MTANRRERGAALLILLMVLGLGVASTLMGAVRPHDARIARYVVTQQALREARDALIGFAITHGRLPRPAVSATDGRETAAPCRNDAGCSGLLPWVALGIAPVDGWGHRLLYSAAPDFTRAPIDFSTAVATKTMQTRRAGGLRYIEGGTKCERSAQCLPALVWSTGERNFGMSAQGIPQAGVSQTNADERNNATATVNLIYRSSTDDNLAEGGDFDDQITWVPLLPLINRVLSARP